ncbi:MAG: hypothetical protein LBH29_05015 [Elusimicrobiota bacterium]|jgi:hypothetical protein|nr:hypothetical protein [Elusimicrobiota bacterium]
MALTQEQLDALLLDTDLGRYDIVRRAIDWIQLKKKTEEYRKLSAVEIIKKSLEDVMEGKATREAIVELRNTQREKERKLEEEMAKL